MKFQTPVRLRLQKDVIVRIHRRLRGKGTINVLPKQEVIPSDIIGTSLVSSGFRTLNLADLLDVAPTKAAQYLKRPVGQRIYKDELLAYKYNWLKGKIIVTSPADGVIDFLNTETGELRMMFLPKKADLPAGVYGVVEQVDKDKGEVIIRTQVSIIYGVFGSGRVRDGILKIISRRDELVGRSLISPDFNEQILAGGALILKDAITAAISAGAAGIISGGINAKDYKGMAGGRLVFPKRFENDVGISIIACEGFGSIPIGEDISDILTKFDGKYVLINGNMAQFFLPSYQSSSLQKVRSTNLPPGQDVWGNTIDECVELAAGMKVRVIGSSYPGEQGKLLVLDQAETVLPSGIKTFMATVETLRRKIKVPVANLEIIDYSF